MKKTKNSLLLGISFNLKLELIASTELSQIPNSIYNSIPIKESSPDVNWMHFCNSWIWDKRAAETEHFEKKH